MATNTIYQNVTLPLLKASLSFQEVGGRDENEYVQKYFVYHAIESILAVSPT